jgi:glycine oxidase
VADAIVIGAGIIGCAVADALGRDGWRVHVLDPRGVGRGATQASAGMLTPYSEGRHDPVLERLGVRSLALWDAFVASLEDAPQGAPLYSRSGSLELALDEEEAADLRHRADILARDGIEHALVSGSDIRQIERDVVAHVHSGLLIPTHGYASAADVAAALCSSAERRGARVTQCRVQRIESDGEAVRVIASTASFTAPLVVLAAGSWGGTIEIAGEPPQPVRPVRGQLLYLSWPEPSLRRIVWGSRCYAVPWPDGTVLVGATLEDAGFDERATVAGVRELLDAMCEIVPAAWHASFTGVRVGLRPGSPDALPVIGRSGAIPGLIHASGHYRNGVLLAPLTAHLVSRIARGDETDPALAIVSPQRFSGRVAT